ncbi:MAG TPA: PAS domain S-box protein [Gammaproteobacteria bacterium]|nr:PAS domain S-box protein [Gammaproteobacteria bacterium]
MNNGTKYNSLQSNISEKHFRGMIESTTGIPWIVDFATFQFTYVGPQAEKILGYPIEQWYETDFWSNHIHPDDREATLNYCVKASQKGKDYNFEYRMIHRDGHSVWILDYVNIVTENGAPVQLQGFMFDISKDKQAAQTLQERTVLLDAMYRASPDMIFIHDNDGRILDVNNNAAQRYGYTIEEMRELSIADVSADPDNLPLVSDCMRRVLSGEELDFEWQARDSNNEFFPVEIRLRKLEGCSAPGTPAVIATIRDITERKRTEESIKNIAAGVSAESGDVFYQRMVTHLAKLFGADYAFIGLLNEDDPETISTLSVFAHGSIAANMSYSLLDTPCAKVIGKGTCCHPCDVQQLYPNDRLLADMGVDSFIGVPLFDSNSRAIGLIEILDSKPMALQQQLTEILEIFAARASAELERDRIHRRLENTRQKLALHVQQTPLGVIEWDTSFCVTDWNPAAEKIFGYSKQEALGKTATELIIPDESLPCVDAIWQALLENHGSTRSTNSNITKNKKNITCEWYNTPLVADNGEVIGVASLVSDVTKRINTEIELEVHREHLEELVEQRTTELTNINQELESFSYSVSHDLRAPLRHIDGFSQVLQEDHAKQLDEEGRQQLQRIRNSAQRMGQLIDDLLVLSRVSRGNVEREPLNLSSMAQDIFNKLQYYDADRKVSISIQSDMLATADHRLVHVLLENLIGNAWKYTSKIDHANISFNAETGEKGETVFCLRDNGAGFDMKYAERLFTAFKRLHSDREFEGTGIGLATVQRIVNRHAGRVWATAEIGKGAAFYFTLDN